MSMALQVSPRHVGGGCKTTGVSGFAFQGTNAHVILRGEAALQSPAQPGETRSSISLLSVQNPREAAAKDLRSMAEFLAWPLLASACK